ncbi:MAG: ATP-binding protein [Verrucomicrobia bacterium]|nr:ATP-binding protein [Verrucomicrobiota bacterium]
MAATAAYTIQASLPELSRVAALMTSFLEDNGTPPAAVFAANLAVEEIVTNTIKYGLFPDAHPGISIAVNVLNDLVEVVVEDEAGAFDPFAVETPDTSAPLAERPVGGLGIHLVRNMLDTYSYERKGHRNITRLTKSFS